MRNSVKQSKTSWMIYAIALLGLGINAIYWGSETIGGENPLSHFSENVTAHVAILSLLGAFPLLALFASRVLVGNHLSVRSRQLAEELAARNRELQELKSFSENIIASVNDLIFVISPDGRFQFVSGNSMSVVGFEPDELQGRQLIDVVAPGSVHVAVNNFERIMWGSEVPPYELEITDGEAVRCIEISSTAYREDGQVIAQVGVAREVTERKKLERHIIDRNRELAALNSMANAVGQSLDLDQVLSRALDQISLLLTAERAWVHFYDSDADELRLKVWKGASDDSEVVKQARRLKPGQGFSGMVAKRGSSLAMNVDDLDDEVAETFRRHGNQSLAAVPMFHRGRLVGVLGVASDSRDHFSRPYLDLLEVASTQVAMSIENSKLYQHLKAKTRELENSNQELSLAAERIGLLIATAEESRSFSVRYDNPQLARCWEVKDCSYVECPSFQASNLRCWQVAGTHCGGEVQGVFAQKLGKCEQCDVYRMARTDRIAALGEMFNNMMAMLEHKAGEEQKLQEQLVQSTKMAAVGELAANIAHEINNPLTGVLCFSSLMRREFPAGTPQARNLEIIERETMRARDIVRNLLDFTRQGGLKKEKVLIDDVLDDTLPLLLKQAELAGIDVKVECAGNLPAVYADVNKMKQVFINIFNNALQAMPAGGSLTIALGRSDGDGQGSCVEVSFADTGVGMDPVSMERIFDPFFTTKDPGEGTGLGLSVSQRIVQEHSGELRVSSQPGLGSTFTVKLPTAILSPGVRRVA